MSLDSEELISRFLDGTATPDELTQLNALVESTPAVATQLSMLAQIDSALRERFSAIGMRDPLDETLQQLNLHGAPALAVAATDSPLAPSTRLPAILFTQISMLQNSPVAFTLLFSVLFYTAFWLLVWKTLSPESAITTPSVASRSKGLGPPVAHLTAVDHCQWGTSVGQRTVSPHERQDFLAGDSVELLSGVAEITFDRGAQILLEGPARLELRSGVAGFLYQGRLTAVVPKQAIGFCIETPSIRVVDLGTEFGVDVDLRGDSEVQVFKGAVEVDLPRSEPSAPREKRQILSGEGVRIGSFNARTGSRKAAAVQAIGATDPRTRFVRTLSGKARAANPVLIDLSRSTFTQSSVLGGYSPQLAVDHDPNSFSHTASEDTHAAWQCNLGEVHPIVAVVLYNRTGQCLGRLRDLTVKILAEDGNTVLWQSDGVNKDNVFGGGRENFQRGPDQLTIDVQRQSGRPVLGQYVRVERTPATVGSALDDINVLSLGECEIYEAEK